MIPRVIKAQYLNGYSLEVQFTDGKKGIVDLAKELDGEVFQPLKDVNYFRNFRVDPEIHTITWPNGADFSPEFLYQMSH